MQMTGDVGAGDLYTFWGGAWDPHDANRLCTSGGNSVQASSSEKEFGRKFSVKLFLHKVCITAFMQASDPSPMNLLYTLARARIPCCAVHVLELGVARDISCFEC